MTNHERTFDLLCQCGAILTNSHFVYPNGRHGASLFDQGRFFESMALVDEVCGYLAAPFLKCCYRGVEVVVGLEGGGAILAPATARHMTVIQESEEACLAVHLERIEGSFRLDRSQIELVAHKNILIVEDALVTGESAIAAVGLMESHEGNVVGVSAVCNRGHITEQYISVRRLHTLVEMSDISYDRDECPMCRQGRPINPNVTWEGARLVGG